MAHEDMHARSMSESPEVANGVVVLAVAGFLLLVLTAMAGLFIYIKFSVPSVFHAPVARNFPAPQLQTSPHADLIRLERQQRAALTHTEWVDKDKGVARIPIDDAIRVIAKRGEHAYDPPEAATAAAPGDAKGSGQ
jgi:hypothetical protein